MSSTSYFKQAVIPHADACEDWSTTCTSLINSFSIFPLLFFEDDIDLADPGEKPKEQNILAALTKHKLKFQAFTAGQCPSIRL